MLKKTLLLVALFSLVVFSQQWQERPSWFKTENCWVSQFGDPVARGRLWMEYHLQGDSCNKEHWYIPFTDSISVAQWIRWSIDGKKTLWRIRKIGEFCGIGPIICLKSNEDVVMSFEGFENPTNGETEIEKCFYFTDTTVTEPGCNWEWICIPDINNYTIRFDFPNGCQPIAIKIWEKIRVEQCDRACEYVDPDGATIVLTLTVIKDWIDPETGEYNL
ncbi:MAG: hypothetical protein ABIK80_02735 [candidate division WOR-3 bacterium]